MSVLPISLDPSSRYYSLEELKALKTEIKDAATLEQLKKIERNKILFSDVIRFIPLENQTYAAYHKDYCIIDDECSLGAFSLRKSIKHMIIINPQAPFISKSDLATTLTRAQILNYDHRLFTTTWDYFPDSKIIFDLALKIHSLAYKFHSLFPDYCPRIHQILSYQTKEKAQISCIAQFLPKEKIQPADTFSISSLSDFNLHCSQIISFLNVLYENNLAHGDLARSNFILNDKGLIQGLVDFDTACEESLLPMLYFKSWISDLKKAFSAMVYFQTNSDFYEWNEEVIVEASPSDVMSIRQKVSLLFDIYETKIYPLFEYLYCADFLIMTKAMRSSLKERTDPGKIFFDFLLEK